MGVTALSSTPFAPPERARSGETPIISVVVPVYNEEKNIHPFLARAVSLLERIGTY
jgi:cellulose synthase/poly-beta-1,6-N-acetylglucosamine synthase-like glycosyltransferase